MAAPTIYKMTLTGNTHSDGVTRGPFGWGPDEADIYDFYYVLKEGKTLSDTPVNDSYTVSELPDGDEKDRVIEAYKIPS